jgi:hypothetical protein
MPRLSSMGTKLYYKPAAEWVQIPDVKSFPSMMGAPEQVDTTCVEDTQKTYAPGQSDPGEMEFTLAYSGQGAGTNWGILRGLQTAGTEADFQVSFPDDSGFRWSAKVALSMGEIGDGNSALEFTCTMFPSGEITPVADTTTP